MTKKHSTKRSLIASILVLCLCLTSFIGTTFAWFTDSVTSANNIIKSGKLDVEMYWAKGTEEPTAANWADASEGAIFEYDLWEPGYAEVRHIKIANEGTLALKYKVNIVANGEIGMLADVIDVYYADPAVQVANRAALTADKKIGTLTEVLAGLNDSGNGTLAAGTADTITLALVMQESAGNEYQEKAVAASFSIQLVATQLMNESDSFGNDYDEDAEYPVVSASSAPIVAGQDTTITIKKVEGNGLITSAKATVPAAAKKEANAKSFSLVITALESAPNGITIENSQSSAAYDIEIVGLADDNNEPVVVTLKLAPGLSGVKVYHYAEEVTSFAYNA